MDNLSFAIIISTITQRIYFIVLPDDAVERRKLGVNKERTTVALKGFI